MADETEKTPEEETAPDAGATDAQDEAVAADDATASGADASSEDAASEPEAAAEPEPAAEPADSDEAKPAAPAEVLSPKQKRTRERAAKFAQQPTRPQQSAAERQAERDAERKQKAQLRSARRKREREKARSSKGATPEPLAPRRDLHPGQQKTRQGIVTSDKASKTIVVRIDVTRRHPFYEKVVRTSTTLHAHDESEDAHIGDTVVVRESRPLSRNKRWRLVEVLERAK
jgi:small subunit ribosomal protein S17